MEKLIFPEFSPQIDLLDDRLSNLTAQVKHMLVTCKVPIDQLEIEAKLGQINFHSNQALPNEIIRFFQTKPTWDILPPQKLLGKAFYEFKSGLFYPKPG